MFPVPCVRARLNVLHLWTVTLLQACPSQTDSFSFYRHWGVKPSEALQSDLDDQRVNAVISLDATPKNYNGVRAMGKAAATSPSTRATSTPLYESFQV